MDEGEVKAKPSHTPGRKRKIDKAVVLSNALQALRLRLGGMTYAEVAQNVIIPANAEHPEPMQAYANESSARRAVLRMLRQSAVGDSSELRDREMARLDELMRVIWPEVLRGKLAAVDRALAIQKQMMAMVPGLAAPQKVEHSGPNGTGFVVELMVPAKGSEDPYPFDNVIDIAP